MERRNERMLYFSLSLKFVPIAVNKVVDGYNGRAIKCNSCNIIDREYNLAWQR